MTRVMRGRRLAWTLATNHYQPTLPIAYASKPIVMALVGGSDNHFTWIKHAVALRYAVQSQHERADYDPWGQLLMARGQRPGGIRGAMAGHITSRRSIVIPAATPEARAQVRERAIVLLSEYTMNVGAKLRAATRAAEQDGPEALARHMAALAERISKLLGDEFVSSGIPMNGARCAAEDACVHARYGRGGTIHPNDACLRQNDPVFIGRAEYFHRECVADVWRIGFDRNAPGADAEVWLLEACARLDAGQVSDRADSWIRHDYAGGDSTRDITVHIDII